VRGREIERGKVEMGWCNKDGGGVAEGKMGNRSGSWGGSRGGVGGVNEVGRDDGGREGRGRGWGIRGGSVVGGGERNGSG